MPFDRDELREFVRASAHDIVFLRQARDSLLTHPKIRADDKSADAVMCRLMAIVGVSAIERSLEIWKGAPFLERFNADDLSNGEKIQVLGQYLADAGVSETKNTLADYLAVKYLRNTMVHLRWKDQERQYIESRGFPTDLARLDHRHWMRIVANVSRMLEHLSHAALFTGSLFENSFLDEITDLSIAAAHPDISHLLSCLVRGSDLATMWWRNLEKLQGWLSRGTGAVEQDGQKLCETALDSWGRFLDATVHAGGLNQGMINRSVETLKQLDSLKLYSRGPVGVDLGVLAIHPRRREVFKALNPAEAEVTEHALQDIARIKEETPHPDEQLPIWKIPPKLAAQVLPLFVSLPPELSRDDVVDALRVGHQVYRFMPNRAPVDLFLVQLPRLSLAARPNCLAAGREALGMFKLRTSWYAWVESCGSYVQRPPYDIWHDFDQRVKQLEDETA